MRISIRLKLLIPIAPVILAVGVGGYYVISVQLSELTRRFITQTAVEKQRMIERRIQSAADSALALASLFTKVEIVREAFQIAHSGDINDEADPRVQTARTRLRKQLAPFLNGYETFAGGGPLRLHFHLPNGRSLVRMWREKQIQRNGKWLDVSDDISDFRQTVLDVNRTGWPVKGIELGRGGFVVRGLAPVAGAGTTPEGSVEVLVDFTPILEASISRDTERLLLYMNKRFLSITHRLQNPAAYPRRGEDFIRVAHSGNETESALVTPALLSEGVKDFTLLHQNGRAAAAFPVTDYKGTPIGVIVYEADITEAKSAGLILKRTLFGLLAALLIFLAFSVIVTTNRAILEPIRRIIGVSKKIGGGDLTETLPIIRKDEIGDLAEALNAMILNFRETLGNMEQDFETVSTSASKISTDVSNVASVTTEQAASVSEITATLSELLNSSKQIADHARTVAEIAERALSRSREGAEVVAGVIDKIRDIEADNRKSITEIKELGSRSREIADIMSMINHIADQTRLIAFNAAIEATSAGEAGRRFGVVAGEIRSLADNVTESTTHIEQRISHIQKAVAHLIEESEKSETGISEGISQSEKTANTLEEIVQEVNATTEAARQISLSTRQQQSASEQVVAALSEIEKGGKQTADSIRRIEEISRRLDEVTAETEEKMRQFKLEKRSPNPS